MVISKLKNRVKNFVFEEVAPPHKEEVILNL